MITNCTVCGKLFDERSSDYADAPDRKCTPCYKQHVAELIYAERKREEQMGIAKDTE